MHYLRIALLLCALSLLGAQVSRAQMIPINNQTIDFVTQLDTYADQMVGNNLPALLTEGQNMLTAIAIVLGVYMLVVALFSQTFAAERTIELVFTYLIAYGMLQFYDSPMPWGNGISFHQIFSREARWVKGLIDLSTLNNVMAKAKDLWDNMEIPYIWDIPGWFVWGFTVFDLVLMWFFGYAVDSIAYYANAIGSLLGPLLIPFFIWQPLSWIFWGWFRFMLIYSLWSVCNAAFLYIYANVMLWYIQQFIGDDYSLGNLFACIFPFTSLVLSGFIGPLLSLKIASDLVSGHASVTSPIAGAARVVAARILP
jgi:hypothetical protein